MKKTEIDDCRYFENDNITDKTKKLKGLKTKIISEEIPKQEFQFDQYLQKLSKQLSQEEKNKQIVQRHRSSQSLKRSRQKKRALEQLNLPFQVYIQSSSASQSEKSKEWVPFYISDSSISGISEQDNEKDKKFGKRIQKIQQGVFSFAKRNKQFSSNGKSFNVLEDLNDQKDKQQDQFEILQKLLPEQVLKGIIKKELSKHLKNYEQKAEFDQSLEQSFSQIQQQVQKRTYEQLEQIVMPYYTLVQNRLTDKINEEYFTKIYLPCQTQKMDEKLYLKQQQLEIKKNQLQTLESLLKEVRNNRKIQSTLDDNKTSNFLIEASKEKIVNPEKLKTSRPKSKKNLIVPLLNLEQLNEQQIQAKRQHKALTSKRKQGQQESDRSHLLEKASSKAGRRYYYDKESHSVSKKNSVENQKKGFKENNFGRMNDSGYGREGKGNNEIKGQVVKDGKGKRYDLRQLMELNKNGETEVKNFQSNNSLNQASQKVPISLQALQHQNKLQLKQFELEQEYKQNLKNVITFQIQHLKSQLDLLMQSLKQLQTKNSDKYLRIEVIDQVNALKAKRHEIKTKLKAKIKEFWKIAQVQPYHNK